MRSRQLQEQFDRHSEEHAASDTEEHRETASDRWFPECHLPPPTNERGHATSTPTASERAYCPVPAPAVGKERIQGSLWARDERGNPLPPNLDDITQGRYFSDCFFMASVAALAASHPEKIVEMIQDHGGGVFTVHLKHTGWSFISPSVTLDFDKDKHAEVGKRGALWPLVLEKAYGESKGGVNNLSSGGSPVGVLRDLQDMQSTTFFVQQRAPDAILAALAKAKHEKQAITALSLEKKDAGAEVRTMREENVGLVFRHAYVVTDVDVEAKRIKLFNPWGHSHPYETGWMVIDDFRRFFSTVNLSGESGTR